MRTRLLLLFAFAAATVLTNVASADNIAHGVEVVVIDAGHGGKFPGAHYGGVYEKDLTLKVALKLGKLIEEGMPGVKVVYTRTTDKTLGKDLAADLQERADIANKAGGDLFLSIHANAAPKATGVRGVETLIMGESSKEQRYNESALFENNREDLIDMSDERTAAIVRAYIQNLQFTYGEYSMAFARCIQNSYLKAGRHSRGVKPQLLRVLYATNMPCALTEIGFMSNAQELAYMKSEKGQNEIARSLYQAVRNYSAYVLGSRMAEEQATANTTAPERSVTPEKRVAESDRKAAEKQASEVARAASGKTPPAVDRKPAADTPAPAKPAEDKPAVKPAETPEKPAVKPDPVPAKTPERPAVKPDPAPVKAPEKPAVKSDPVPAKAPEKPAVKPEPAPAKSPEKPAVKPDPVPAKTPEKPAADSAERANLPVRYTVQVMASATAVPLDSSEFRSYRGKVKQFRAEGRFSYKYGVGEFETREAAQRRLGEVRKVFPKAFVVAVRGTQIVK